jgi:glycosyltransferase involved in cell wall biosynthesis
LYRRLLYQKFLEKKIIANYHAGYFLKFFDNSVRFVVRNTLRMADHVTTPLAYLDNEFSSIGIKIKQVPNVIDLQEFSFKKRTSFKPRFISSRHLLNVYGNDTVIRAFAMIVKQYPQAELIMAGDGNERDELEDLTCQLQIEDHVTFTGYIDTDLLLDYYEQSDVFLNGSRRDNMPISILEAFSVGLPVVSTNPMGIPFLVSDGSTGLLCEVDDFEQLAKNAIRIIEEPEYGKTLACNARKFVHSLTWPNVYPLLSEVYFE